MNIYVGNLCFDTDENKLQEEFGQYGEVESVTIIKNNHSGRSRGFGFVVMPDNEQAQSAIENINGKEVDGWPLKVNEAREREERS